MFDMWWLWYCIAKKLLGVFKKLSSAKHVVGERGC